MAKGCTSEVTHFRWPTSERLWPKFSTARCLFFLFRPIPSMSLKASLDHPYLQPRNEKPRIHYFTPEGVAARSYGFIKAALPIKSIAGVGGLFGSLLGYIVVTYNLHRAYLATPLVFVLVPYVAPFLSSMFGLCENRYMKGVMSVSHTWLFVS